MAKDIIPSKILVGQEQIFQGDDILYYVGMLVLISKSVGSYQCGEDGLPGFCDRGEGGSPLLKGSFVIGGQFKRRNGKLHFAEVNHPVCPVNEKVYLNARMISVSRKLET